VAALDRGRVVGLPTESSFALAARVDRPSALAELAHLKAERAKPIGLMIAHPRQLPGWVEEVPAIGFDLARAYWPGPLTLVMTATANVPEQITAGGPTVGFRVPGLDALVALLTDVGVPVTATSANRPGESPVTSVIAFEETFPDVPVWAEFAESPGGPPSTVVDIRDGGLRILRPGAIEL